MAQRISLTLASLTIWQAWDFGRKYEQNKNRHIDDDPDKVDERGFGRLAYEPFNRNEEVMELNEVFAKA